MNNRYGYFSPQSPQTQQGNGGYQTHNHGAPMHQEIVHSTHNHGIPMRQEVIHSGHAHFGFLPPPLPAPVVVVATPTYGYGTVEYDDYHARQFIDNNSPVLCCNVL